MFAPSANIRDMRTTRSEPRLGPEIRRLRLKSGATLRGLAGRLGVSAAHMSDIEHDRRRPSEKLLRQIATELRPFGASFGAFQGMITGIDPEIRDWVAKTPGVRKLLRKVRESGQPPEKLLKVLEESTAPKRSRRGAGRTAAERSAPKTGRSPDTNSRTVTKR